MVHRYFQPLNCIKVRIKINALGFHPGLVGGHCIGVDPYYLTYQAQRVGHHSQLMLAARRINDGMGAYVADAAVKQLILAGKAPKKSKVVILGMTFKENCPDVRNSKVYDIIKQLRTYDIEPVVVDHCCDPVEVMHEYGLALQPVENAYNADCVIVAVAHTEYRNMSLADYDKFFGNVDNREKIIIDVKSLYSIEEAEQLGIKYWRL